MVRHFRIIKYLFWFRQRRTIQRGSQYFVITKPFQNTRTFRINIVAQKSGINTWICSYFLLIKRLDQFQCFIGRIGEFLVTLYLKGSQVKQTRSIFLSVFLTNTGYHKRKVFDTLYQGFTFFTIGDRIDTRIVYFLFSTVFFFFCRNFFITFADKCGESSISIVCF